MITASAFFVAMASELPLSSVQTSSDTAEIGARNLEWPLPQYEVFDLERGWREFSGPIDPSPDQAPGFEHTSEFMLGSVAVGVILPESDGSIDPSTEDWSDKERKRVAEEITKGVVWWLQKAGDHRMPFRMIAIDWTHLNTPVNIPYEPINRCGYKCSTGELKWSSEILTKLGYSGSREDKTYAHNNYLRNKFGTNWAFTVFVADSSNDKDNKFSDLTFGYATPGGPRFVMTYGNNGWGIGKMDKVTAHEMGHIFWAMDEYAASKCNPASKRGYLGRTNDNCENGGHGKSNIMNDNRMKSPSPRIETREQVGWRDSDGDGIPDILDTFPNTELYAHPDPTPDRTPTFQGRARVVPLPTKNPSSRVSCTINTIFGVLYRIDGGWIPYLAQASDGKWDEAVEDFTFTTKTLSVGTHTICATAYNSVRNAGSTSCQTLLIDAPPEANAGPDQVVNEGETVTFDGSASGDDVGISEYKWDFDSSDGVNFNPPDATGVSPTHVYGDNGVYTVTLMTVDTSGQTDIDTMLVTVVNVAPTVDAGSGVTINEGEDASIVSTFSDLGWLDTHTATVDWGEGSVSSGAVSEENNQPDATGTVTGSHTYGDNGVFTVTVTVCDDDGGCTSDTLAVSVLNVAPSVTLLQPSVIAEGQSADYKSTATDPGSDDLEFSWSWEMRGGCDIATVYLNDPLHNPDPFPSPSVNPRQIEESQSCVFGDDGTFTVTLTVTDDDGLSTSVSTTVTVYNVAPTVDSLPSLTIDEGQKATFTGHATDPGSDDLTFEWTWDYRRPCDGTTLHMNDPSLGPDPFPSPTVNPRTVTESAACAYGDNGVFTITLTVTDDDGLATQVSTTVTVNNLAPTIDPEIRAYVLVDVTLRASGEKWHDVDLTIYEDSTVVDTAWVIRYPGSPDDQSMTAFGIEMDIMACDSSAVVEYTPTDDALNGQIWGSTPVWIILTFEDGQEVWLDHTFNVRHPHKWTWTIPDFCKHINAVGLPIYFEATASDEGSDDLTFTWSWDDGTADTATTYFNDGSGADPYPSPDVSPITQTDTAPHTFVSSGKYNITLKVVDDDGGQATMTVRLTI
jgi:PKD repeat protein